jgi:hypothetical protein
VKKTKTTQQELTRLGGALRALGGLGGSVAGSILGYPAQGLSIGSSLGASLSRWLGSGDYTVQSNSIVNRSNASVPTMHQTSNSVIIRHREFIDVVKGSINFTGFDLTINPGIPACFPWLAKLSTCYQQYKIRGMVFHYVPTSGNSVSSTNPALGAVMMQTSYRSNDSSPANRVEMMNEYFACESVPSEPFCHPIECSPKENPFQIHYVRSGPIPANDSSLMYDTGTLFVRTQGMPADGNVVGDLWCTYEIELLKPILRTNVANFNGYALYAHDIITASFSTTNLFGTGAIAYHYSDSSYNLPVTYGAGGVINIPASYGGYFEVNVVIKSSSNFSVVDMSTFALAYTNCVAANNQYAAAYTKQTKAGSTDGINWVTFSFGVLVSTVSIATITVTGVSLTGPFDSTNVSVSYLGLLH